ncbi:MAG: hypothetical protein KGL39_53805 [Patescibacteria group bacterium]|nr:hypothetical protein [Patescibacteria group bacterium]
MTPAQRAELIEALLEWRDAGASTDELVDALADAINNLIEDAIELHEEIHHQ